MNVNLGKYQKAIVALLAALGVLASVLSDGNISGEDAIALIAAFGGVVAVYQVPNKTETKKG